MKKRFFISAPVLLSVIVLLCACSSRNSDFDGPLSISIAKKAEFSVTSGGRVLAKSVSDARSVATQPEVLYFKEADCPDLYKADFPDQKLFKDECNHVYACIKEDAKLIGSGMNPKYEVEKGSFTCKAFYIVNAYSSKDHDADGGKSDVAGDMHNLAINGVYIKEFRTNVCVAADLVITANGLQKITYDDSFGQKSEAVTVDEWKLFYIPDYGYYAGMDYKSAKAGTDGDGDYSDWVVKVIPATPKVDPVDETNGMAEVNLSINDEHVEGDFIATKLSIHIRALTDAEVFIPVDKSYYCVADDMDISLSHKQADVIYNTEPQHVEANVGGKTVMFTVKYEDNGIRVSTEGIEKSVIDCCAEEYADGITFEVWNYFKGINRETLKTMLDRSTIKFLNHNPVVYVNAIAKLNGYNSSPVYSAFNENGQLVPYIDEACTQQLDQKFWTRETEDSKDYVFIGEPNPADCNVVPVETAYVKSEQDHTDTTLKNYNVTYSLK